MEITQVPQQENHPAENTLTWEKPIFKVISVSLECSAYAYAI